MLLVAVVLVDPPRIPTGLARSLGAVDQSPAESGEYRQNASQAVAKIKDKSHESQSVAMVAGLCFVGAVNLDQLGIQAIEGIIYILVCENTFFPMYATLALIPQELPLLLREYREGMYSIHLYYVARIISLVSSQVPFYQSSLFAVEYSLRITSRDIFRYLVS